ncbi:hypothetical protein D3C87_796620 [compost metagenome]
MKIRLFLVAFLVLGVLSCTKDNICECSDGYRIEMTGNRKQVRQACEKLSDDGTNTSCKIN